MSLPTVSAPFATPASTITGPDIVAAARSSTPSTVRPDWHAFGAHALAVLHPGHRPPSTLRATFEHMAETSCLSWPGDEPGYANDPEREHDLPDEASAWESDQADGPDPLDLLDDIEGPASRSHAARSNPHAERPVARSRRTDAAEGSPPSRGDVLAIMALARAIGTAAARDALFSATAATVLICPDQAMVERVARIVTAFRPLGSAAPRPSVMILAERSTGGAPAESRDYIDALDQSVPLFVVATARPDPAHAIGYIPCLRLDPAHPDVLLAALEELLPSVLGRAALAAEMPAAATLRRLDAGRIATAFREPTAIAVVRALRRLAGDLVASRSGKGLALEDLPGLGKTGTELVAMARDLRSWADGRLPWSDVPNGVLLEGPPGTGKTTLAEAVAVSAGAAFFPTTYGDLQRVGRLDDLLAGLHKLFADARANAPSVIFLDEVEAFGNRHTSEGANKTYDDKVTTALLGLLDGAVSREGVIVIGATNHPEKLDAAFKRQDRLGRTLQVGPPGPRDLAHVWRFHLGADLPTADLAGLALQATGLTVAEVRGVVQSARAVARGAARPLSEADLAAALDDVCPPLGADFRRRLAVHEAGHAIVGHLVGHGRPTRVTVTPTGGRTDFRRRPRVVDSRSIFADLVTMLAGRCAERLVFGDTSGSAGGDGGSDLAQATRLALGEVLSYGLDTMVWRPVPVDPSAAFALDPRLRARVERRLEAAAARATALLAAHRETLATLASDIVMEGILETDDLDDLLNRAALSSSI